MNCGFYKPHPPFPDVKPGYHQITVTGESAGTSQSFNASEVAHVEAGKLAEVTVNLE